MHEVSNIFSLSETRLHEEDPQKSLFTGVINNNVSLVLLSINAGANINQINNRYGGAPIHLVANHVSTSVAELLLSQHNIEVNLQTETGNTALLLACKQNNINAVIILLKSLASPNISNYHNRTPLHEAVLNSNLKIVKHLILHGVKINIADRFENTPLSLSLLEKPNLKIAKILLQNNASAEFPSDRMCPLLIEIVMNCKTEKDLKYIDILLEFGADIDIYHPLTKVTCLHVCAVSGFPKLAEFLLARGAQILEYDHLMRNPIRVAVDHENYPVLKVFCDYMSMNQVDCIQYFSTNDIMHKKSRMKSIFKAEYIGQCKLK